MTTIHNNLFEQLPSAALLIGTDSEIISINRKARALLHSCAENLNKPCYFIDFIDNSYRTLFLQQLKRLKSENLTFDVFVKTTRSELEHLSISGSLAEEGKYILLLDIIEQCIFPTNERLLLESQYNNSPAGILIVDKQMQILSYNRNFLRLWNIPEYIQRKKDNLVSLHYILNQVENPEQFIGDIHTLYQDYNLTQTDEIHLKDGRVFYRHIYPLKNQNAFLGRAWYFLDVSELHDTRELLSFMAHHDPLTGLPNRRLFHDLLRQNLAQAQRNKKQVAILFLDIDNFKSINDYFGHQEGDEFLKQIGEILSGALRESDIICRWGGDEFVIALMDTAGLESAEIVANKIRKNVEHYAEQCYPGFGLGTSIGVSLYPNDSDKPDRLIRNADTAMYMAKRSGKNRFYIFVDEEVRAIFTPRQ